MFTLDISTEFGARTADRLQKETVIWLTTVDPRGAPRPVPVWYLWTGSDFLIFSQPNKPKLRNAGRNPQVALSFNSTETGGNIVVFTGTARLENATPIPAETDAYNEKYADDLKRLGMTSEQFHQDYSVPMRVTPEKLRGF
ncbi:MAG: TIGR03667 family PPOX class F420-dependent oxidoreductase [Thermomicrobiales bacterium]